MPALSYRDELPEQCAAAGESENNGSIALFQGKKWSRKYFSADHFWPKRVKSARLRGGGLSSIQSTAAAGLRRACPPALVAGQLQVGWVGCAGLAEPPVWTILQQDQPSNHWKRHCSSEMHFYIRVTRVLPGWMFSVKIQFNIEKNVTVFIKELKL